MLLMGKREVNVFLTREVIQSYELAGPAACTACSRRRMTVRNKPSNPTPQPVEVSKFEGQHHFSTLGARWY